MANRSLNMNAVYDELDEAHKEKQERLVAEADADAERLANFLREVDDDDEFDDNFLTEAGRRRIRDQQEDDSERQFGCGDHSWFDSDFDDRDYEDHFPFAPFHDDEQVQRAVENSTNEARMQCAGSDGVSLGQLLRQAVVVYG